MPTLSIHQRLDALIPALLDPRLLNNRGIGNEIGFYIFDYDPEHDPLVEQHLPRLKSQLTHSPQPLEVLEINLYHTILEILDSRRILQKAFDLEASKGNTNFSNAILPLVRPQQIVDRIQRQLQGNEQLVLLTGVGASWPLVRSHSILNNLHPVLDRTPLVMFFPGSYDGHELRLFNLLKDDNYYRAFPLIPRQQRQL